LAGSSGKNMKKNIVAPRGYYFRVVKGIYGGWSVKLYKRKIGEIGHINLVRVYTGCYATHSHLDNKFHNKGLGALLYAKAIQWGIKHGYRIRSSGGSSRDAQRVWRGSTLKRWFDIKVKPGIDYYSKNPDPNRDTFYPRLKETKCRARSKKVNVKRRK